jgi:dihydroorotase-like cyclic amidohydrolase
MGKLSAALYPEVVPSEKSRDTTTSIHPTSASIETAGGLASRLACHRSGALRLVWTSMLPTRLCGSNRAWFRLGANLMIRPPLRHKSNQQALWDGFPSGLVDTLTIAHASGSSAR